jgi:transcriptional regulator with XRE-family HTH domain
MTANSTIIDKQRQAFKSFMAIHKLNAFAWAKKAGISEATVRHYLNGRNQSITIVNLEKLAKAAGVNTEELLRMDNIEISKEDDNIVKVNKDLFIQTFTDLNNFIIESDIKLDPQTHAHALLAWYELAQMLQKNNSEPLSLEPFKELLQQVIAAR